MSLLRIATTTVPHTLLVTSVCRHSVFQIISINLPCRISYFVAAGFCSDCLRDPSRISRCRCVIRVQTDLEMTTSECPVTDRVSWAKSGYRRQLSKKARCPALHRLLAKSLLGRPQARSAVESRYLQRSARVSASMRRSATTLRASAAAAADPARWDPSEVW